MTLTEAIRAHYAYANYVADRMVGLPATNLLDSIARDIRHQLSRGVSEADHPSLRRIKQAIRDAAKNGKVKSGKGRPRKTYEVACAHCGRTNTISLVRE